MNSLFFLSHFEKVDGMPVIELFDYLSVVVLQPSGSHDRVHRGRCKTHPRRTQSHQILINNGTGEMRISECIVNYIPQSLDRTGNMDIHSFNQLLEV